MARAGLEFKPMVWGEVKPRTTRKCFQPRMNPARLSPQPQILDCGGNPAGREPRRFGKQPAVRKAVSPLRSSLRCASPRQAATAVQIFVIRARSCRIVVWINVQSSSSSSSNSFQRNSAGARAGDAKLPKAQRGKPHGFYLPQRTQITQSWGGRLSRRSLGEG